MTNRRLRSVDRRRYDAIDEAHEALQEERARYREAIHELDREFDNLLEQRLADAEPDEPRRLRRRADREP